MSACIAVTGATGFVGKEALRQLLAAGFTVRALVRQARAPQMNVVWVRGSLDDAQALDELLSGAQVVLHIAGAIHAPDRAAFDAANAIGTANVVAAMRRAGLKRLVHVSSLAAREPELSDYGGSKAGAEAHVRASGLAWTMVRPPAIYGPGDTEFSEELFELGSKGLIPLPPTGRACLLHVQDLGALLVALCATSSPTHNGVLYEPSDGTPGGLSHRELAATIGQAIGRKVIGLPLPRWMLSLVAALDGMVRGKHAKMTPDRVRYMCHPDWTTDPMKQPPPTLWTPKWTPQDGLKATAEAYFAARTKKAS